MKRRNRLLILAAVLLCAGGVYRIAVHRTATAAGTSSLAAARDWLVTRKASTPAAASSPPPTTPASAADLSCDLTALDLETTDTQDADETAAQTRYDLALAQRLRKTGNPIDQAVASMLGRIEDWEPRELSDQVSAVASAAVLTSDGQLYALALKACSRLQNRFSPVAAPDACSQLVDGQLTLLQPDSIMAWLQAAQTARLHQDTAAELDAMYHASVASQGGRPGDVAIDVVKATMSSTDPAWLRYGTLRKLSDQILPGNGWGALHEGSGFAESCDPERLGDANRRELCDKLAHHLLADPVGSAGLWAGTGISVMLGWSPERLRSLPRQVYPMFLAQRALASFPPHDCRADVHLAILEATLAHDAPSELSAPRVRAAVDTLTQKRRDAEAAKEEAEQEAKAAEAKAKGIDAIEPESSEASASSASN